MVSSFVVDPIDFHCTDKNSQNIFKAYFVFHRKKKAKWFWNDKSLINTEKMLVYFVKMVGPFFILNDVI